MNRFSVRTIDGVRTYALTGDAWNAWSDYARQQECTQISVAFRVDYGILAIVVAGEGPSEWLTLHTFAHLSPGFWLEFLATGQAGNGQDGEIINLPGPEISR